nr:hypothetical protein [Prolixibacteraceae bacterium]
GLSAAYYLQMQGIQTVIYDRGEQAGGQLRSAIPDNILPKEALGREIEAIRKLGVVFKLHTPIGKTAFEQLRRDYDAVVVATGIPDDESKTWDITANTRGFEADDNTYHTNLKRVFAVGNALRSSKLAIRSLAQGKEAAAAIGQILNGKPVVGQPLKFNSKFGKLVIPEYAQYLKESNEEKRTEPARGILEGLTTSEVKTEAARCLHCDCRKINTCKLRDYSDHYGAVQKRFAYDERKPVRKNFHKTIVYEPEKCIKCGICVRLTAKHQEEFGFTYIGRGFDVEIGIPFNEPINEGLKKIAEKVADACPTGALARR